MAVSAAYRTGLTQKYVKYLAGREYIESNVIGKYEVYSRDSIDEFCSLFRERAIDLPKDVKAVRLTDAFLLLMEQDGVATLRDAIEGGHASVYVAPGRPDMTSFRISCVDLETLNRRQVPGVKLGYVGWSLGTSRAAALALVSGGPLAPANVGWGRRFSIAELERFRRALCLPFEISLRTGWNMGSVEHRLANLGCRPTFKKGVSHASAIAWARDEIAEVLSRQNAVGDGVVIGEAHSFWFWGPKGSLNMTRVAQTKRFLVG